MKFHLEIHASEISYLKDGFFFFPGKFGRENNMPKKLKEKNDQHLPKSSSYVNILQLVPDKLDESHPAPPGVGGRW